MTASVIRDPRARDLQGNRAGIVSRLVADGIDYGIVFVIYIALLFSAGVVDFLLTSDKFHVPDPPVIVSLAMSWGIMVLYLAAGWGGTGRTFGKSVMGLRVATRQGLRLRPWRAVARAALCVTIPWVILWVIVSRKNLGIHDVLLRTNVVYDWDVGV